MTTTLELLLIVHPHAGIIISGDRNSIDITALLSIDSSLRQTVKLPTKGAKILDVIVTNLARYFHEPEIVPPISPDYPGKGVPSDHCGVFATPNTNSNEANLRTKISKVIRPLPESLLHVFQAKLETQDFSLTQNLTADEMVLNFQQILNKLVIETFPEKNISIYPDDLPYFTESLRKMKRQRLRQYNRHGKNEKYFELKKKFEEKIDVEMKKYLEKIELEVTEGKRGVLTLP